MSKLTKRINNILDKTVGVKIKRSRKKMPFTEWPDKSPVGMVKVFKSNKIVGWVSSSKKAAPVEVTLNVNGFPVYKTRASVKSTHSNTGVVKEFYIGVRDLWAFCRRTDKVTVRVGDKILPISGQGVYKKPSKNGSKTLGELKALLADGYVFSKKGVLQLKKTNDASWQDGVMELYYEVEKTLKQKHDIDTFLIYGSLLGQVREGSFIGHDDDMDIAYISKHKDGEKVVEEVADLAVSLAENDMFDVELRKTVVHIHAKGRPEVKVDLFHLFFDDKDVLSFPFGVAGTTTFTKEDWIGTRTDTLSDFKVRVPVASQVLIEYIYGPTWRTPVAGFSWAHSRVKCAKSAHISGEVRRKVSSINPKIYMRCPK